MMANLEANNVNAQSRPSKIRITDILNTNIIGPSEIGGMVIAASLSLICITINKLDISSTRTGRTAYDI